MVKNVRLVNFKDCTKWSTSSLCLVSVSNKIVAVPYLLPDQLFACHSVEFTHKI